MLKKHMNNKLIVVDVVHAHFNHFTSHFFAVILDLIFVNSFATIRSFLRQKFFKRFVSIAASQSK